MINFKTKIKTIGVHYNVGYRVSKLLIAKFNIHLSNYNNIATRIILENK